jgi:deoxyxylulose-5-phosphate synthase
LFNKIRFSEYTLYGIFVEKLLGIENTWHFPSKEFLIRYIGPKSYGHDIRNLEQLLKDFNPEPGEVGMLLQKGRSKGKGISPDALQYEKAVYGLWDRLNK